jgi:hypothetical protein
VRSLAQVQLAESSVVDGVNRNLAKSVKAGHCTASVLFLYCDSLQCKLPRWLALHGIRSIAIENSNLTVGILVYALAQGALDCETEVVSARIPTPDEIRSMFD